jgi:hypothetical protein
MRKIIKQPKEKSLFRKWLDIRHEQVMTKKALRLAMKQEWGVDFLTALLVKASRVRGQALEMTIVSASGAKIEVRTTDTPTSAAYRDDNIFNHLDDEMRIAEFIRNVQGAR